MDNERMVRMLELKINVFEGIIGLFKASWSRVPCLAAGLGFEPRLLDPESSVLPLDDPAIL